MEKRISVISIIVMVLVVALISSLLTLTITIKSIKLIETSQQNCLLIIKNQTYYYEKQKVDTPIFKVGTPLLNINRMPTQTCV